MTQMEVFDVTFPSRDATTKSIAWIQAKFATERATYVSSLPGSPGKDMGQLDVELIVDSLCGGVVEHLKSLADHPAFFQRVAQIHTDLADGDGGFQRYVEILLSHVRATFQAVKRGFGSTPPEAAKASPK